MICIVDKFLQTNLQCRMSSVIAKFGARNKLKLKCEVTYFSLTQIFLINLIKNKNINFFTLQDTHRKQL